MIHGCCRWIHWPTRERHKALGLQRALTGGAVHSADDESAGMEPRTLFHEKMRMNQPDA